MRGPRGRSHLPDEPAAAWRVATGVRGRNGGHDRRRSDEPRRRQVGCSAGGWLVAINSVSPCLPRLIYVPVIWLTSAIERCRPPLARDIVSHRPIRMEGSYEHVPHFECFKRLSMAIAIARWLQPVAATVAAAFSNNRSQTDAAVVDRPGRSAELRADW